MKRLIALLLLASLLINTVGYFYLFEYQRYRLQLEMEAALDGGKVRLTILEIPKPEVNKHFKRIHNREFLFHGKMFDVLYEKHKKASTVFYCVQDHKEDILIAGMKKAIQKRIADQLKDQLIKIALLQNVKSLKNRCISKIIPPPEYLAGRRSTS
jgi:hypothetical protein